jgi:hypothetical protein
MIATTTSTITPSVSNTQTAAANATDNTMLGKVWKYITSIFSRVLTKGNPW